MRIVTLCLLFLAGCGDSIDEVVQPPADTPPETHLYLISECDCPQPPISCDPQKMVPAGWLSGVNVTIFPRNEWRMFCEGDTLPNLAMVTFYVTREDDSPAQTLEEATGLAETLYRFRYESRSPDEVPRPLDNETMRWSSPALVGQDLLLPEGGPFRGAMISWTTCGFDYTFQANAEDEQRGPGDTPAALEFKVNGSPMLVSLIVPKVIVFVPACPPNLSFLCIDPPVFGPDTLAVLGEHIEEPDGDFFALGHSRFEFPFKAYGHDHQRDKNPPGQNWYSADEVGRIRAWRYTFDCTEPQCQDQTIPGETAWRREVRDEDVDPPGQEVFDEGLQVTVALDTFCTVTPCTFANAQLYLKSSRFGRYEFTLQGRDSEPFSQRCQIPSDLGVDAAIFQFDMSEHGRRTEILAQDVVWLQYRDVRPAKSP